MIIETDLKDTVGYMLAQVCKLHRQRADELLTEIGLHVGQEMILVMLLDNEGITQTELAERMMSSWVASEIFIASSKANRPW